MVRRKAPKEAKTKSIGKKGVFQVKIPKVSQRDIALAKKVAALIHDFLLKLGDGVECAELRDALNLALFQLQRYYRLLQKRLGNTLQNSLLESFQVCGSTTFSLDPRDKFTWKWINLEKSGTLRRHNSNSDKIPELLCASQSGDNRLIVQIIDQGSGSEFHETDVLGRNSLMYAVNSYQLDTVELLLNQGIDINRTAADGATALHWACHHGNDEALEILLQYGADVAIGDAFGRMPIHWAAVCEDTKCLQLLLDHGADVSARDHDGMTPSMWASHFDLLENLRFLQGYLEKDELERDDRGRTWVHWSIRRTEPMRCLTTLLTYDLSSICDDEGKTVMHVAAELGSLPAIKVILSVSGNQCLEQRDQSSRTPLILATMGGQGESVNLLLAEGADAASVDECGATAWDYARARQLHYCMLIVASYLRQQQKQDRAPSPGGASHNDQHPVIGKKVNKESSPDRSVPHPPAQSNDPATGVIRTPRSSRLVSQMHHAFEDTEDGAEHISAFQKVVSKKVNRPLERENSNMDRLAADERTTEERRGIGQEQRTGQGIAVPNSKPQQSKGGSRSKQRNPTTDRRNRQKLVDDDTYDKDWTTEEESDREIRPATNRRRQSISRDRQTLAVTTTAVKSGAVIRPLNPATRYHGKGDSATFTLNSKDEYAATDEDNDEESQDEGDRLNMGFGSFVTTSPQNNTQPNKGSDRRTNTQAPVATKRQAPRQRNAVVVHKEMDAEEVESDVSVDEIMTGFRNGGRQRNSQSKAIEILPNSQGSGREALMEGQKNRSRSAARTDGRSVNVVMATGPPAKYHTQHPGRRKEERLTSPPPEPRNFAVSRDASPFDLMPLSPRPESKTRPRVAPAPSKNMQLTAASGSSTPSSRSSGVNNISPLAVNRPSVAGAVENSGKGRSNRETMVNQRRTDSAVFPTGRQVSPRIQSDLRRRPRQDDYGEDDDDEGGNNEDDYEDEEDRSSENGNPVQLGQVRSGHQVKGSLTDHQGGSGLQRNLKGSVPLQNGLLPNAQLSRDVNNLLSKGRQLSPLIIPQRAKQTIARIPPVVNVDQSSSVLQKVTEMQATRKQPNGQLPPTKFR